MVDIAKAELNLKIGDHIRVWRGGYYHHGIYCGDGSVIHYARGLSQKENPAVKQDLLEKFAFGGEIEVESSSGSLASDEIIERAKSRMGESQYNLVFNNCEHFANWCRTGNHKSEQVESIFYMVNNFVTPVIVSVAQGIYKVYKSEKEKTRYPEHLPQPALILFQKFKKAYENKNIQDLRETISENYEGDIYGETKTEFIELMTYNFQQLKYAINPHLRIEILNISYDEISKFSAVIAMKANLLFLGITIPFHWDAGKLFCEAKPEGQYNYWRITKLLSFEE